MPTQPRPGLGPQRATPAARRASGPMPFDLPALAEEAEEPLLGAGGPEDSPDASENNAGALELGIRNGGNSFSQMGSYNAYSRANGAGPGEATGANGGPALERKPSIVKMGSIRRTDSGQDRGQAKAPVKKRVAIRTNSISSNNHYAPSAAASSAMSSAMGNAMLQTSGLGLAILQRDEWSAKEIHQRNHVLPILKLTLGQIDGSVKPKFSHFQTSTTPAQNMEDFGKLFYETLFEEAPQVRDDLFSKKPVEVLAIKLSLILSELIRLLEMDVPALLGATIAEMALRHIEYGLEKEHIAPFRDVMVNSIKKCISAKGHKWHKKTQSAWMWALNEISGLLMEAVQKGRPKVETLKRSWAFLCEKMHEESMAKGRRSSLASRLGSQAKSGLRSKMSGIRDAPKDDSGDGGEAGGGGNGYSDDEEEPLLGMPSGIDDGYLSFSSLKETFRMGGVKNVVKALAAGRLGEQSKAAEFSLWQKKDMQQDPEYLAGRLAVGKAFLDVFAARNHWAVQQFDFGLNPVHAEKMGEALELIVSSATKPQVLQHRLRVLALGHVQMGIKPEMFKKFEQALFEFLSQVLGNYHMFTKETEEAWQWMWDIVCAAFTRHMISSEKILGGLNRSWEYIETNCDLNDISDLFFDNLFKIVPELQTMFVKPKKMQSVMFNKALDLIVRSASDTRVMEVDLKAIAMRHIKYDIHAEHLQVFGQVLLEALSTSAGVENWDEEIEMAWADIYGHISAIFIHVISTGRNLVSKALATSSADELRRAMDIVPRGQRVISALEIDVDDSVVSPIVWTIVEGQMHLTDVLLKDILTIRGDRNSYYYGKSLLWNKHPWIAKLLVEKAPKLLKTFLDGHLWTSKFVEGGCRRVNYYVQELYGDPSAPGNWNPYNTPLGLFVRRLPASELHVFAHPTVRFVVDLKWSQFGRKDFMMTQMLNLLNLAFATVYIQIGADQPVTSLVLACIQLVFAILRLLMYFRAISKQIATGSGTVYTVGRLRVVVPIILQDFFLVINLLSSCMVIALFAQTKMSNVFLWDTILAGHDIEAMTHEEWVALHDPQQLYVWADIAAFTTGLLWFQMAEAFKVTTKLSALLFAMMSVISDVMRFILVLGVWALGFSVMLYWLFVGSNLKGGAEIHDALYLDLQLDEKSDIATLIYYVIVSCLGLTGIQVVMEADWLVRGVYAVCVLTTVVVLLNLLVSTMVSTYETLQRSFIELAVKTRAELVLRGEEASSVERRWRMYSRCNFHAKVDFEAEDDGPSGGVQVMVPTQNLAHPAFNILDRVERYSGAANPKVPWEAENLISKFSTPADFGGPSNKNSNNEILRVINNEVQRLGSELYVMKSGLKADDELSSAQSGQSAAESGDQSRGQNGGSDQGGRGDWDDLGEPSAPVAEAEEDKPAELDVSKLRAVSVSEMLEHNHGKSLWLAVDGLVRDVTSLLGYHPGGQKLLLDSVGKDASDQFHSSHMGPSFTIASATLKSMPLIGRFDDSAMLPGAVFQDHFAEMPSARGVPSLPLGSLSGSPPPPPPEPIDIDTTDGLPMYTPRDIDLDLDI